jgi:MSHA biogenesis protein MshK
MRSTRSTLRPIVTALLLGLYAGTVSANPLADPTRPSNAKDVSRESSPGIRLEGILRSEGRLLAIVNGKIVRAGDRIGDSRIDEIFTDSIRYTRAGHTSTARLTQKHISVRTNVVQSEEQT